MNSRVHPYILSTELGQLFQLCLRKNINIGLCNNLAYYHQQRKLLEKLQIEIYKASENYNRNLTVNYANNKLNFLQKTL
jgi:hypothetical protein